MALSASAKDYLSRFFPGPPSPLWETDPEFMELFANFALDEVVNQGDLDDAARMMAILAALLGCQGVEEYRVLLPAALRAGITPVQVKEILYQSVAYLGIGRVSLFLRDESGADGAGRRPAAGARLHHHGRDPAGRGQPGPGGYLR